tara:strand:- start:11854 stop:12543 length:690 start_codon:yes stop_codon:yes gene_type:complete
MAKVNELVYDVREAVKAFSDDTELDNRYILYQYNNKRAKYLRQDLNQYQKTVDISITQTLCLALEEVSLDECGMEYDCGTLLRTTQPLPKPLDLHTKPAITKVKPTNRLAISFNFITKEKAAYADSAPFAKAVYSFYDPDGYLYVYSNSDSYKLLDCLTVSGVFRDPTALAAYSTCCNCKVTADTVCFDEDTSEYPLPLHYIDIIRNEIITELLQKAGVQEDKINNSTD